MGLKGNGSKILDTHRRYTEGEPLKNNLAIAYAMKRKAMKKKKMADGGEVKDDSNAGSSLADTASNFFSAAKSGSQQASSTPPPDDKYDAIRKQNQANMGYAKGGEVGRISSLEDMLHKASEPDMVPEHVDYKLRPTQFDKARVASNEGAMREDDKDLNEMPVDMKQSTEDADDSLVMRIMHKRYSKGGMVANETDIDSADSMPAQFDDLVLRDDLESTYGDDDNAGDALGNAQEDEDRKDIVARIMASRRKKDRLPNPR